MTGRDMFLAAMVSVVWGFGFVTIKVGLESFSAPQLTAIRFLIACLPVFVLPRPAISWALLVLIGLTLFTGQFLLLFFAFAEGMPPGLASVTQQMQVFFTVLLASLFLRDIPSKRQCLGMAIAFAGLLLIGLTVGADLSLPSLGLALGGALSWAVGNVLIKSGSAGPILPLVVWASLVPPLPALLVSSLDGSLGLPQALASATWMSLAAALYLGAVATIWGYAVWGKLLRRYPTGTVAPFALLSPCAGVVSSALIFGEVFTPLRYLGMALICAGLAIVVMPSFKRTLGPRNESRSDARPSPPR